jgi:hypothetical protein
MGYSRRSESSLILPTAVREQLRLLPQRHDAPWPALYSFIERGAGNPIITRESD